MQTKVSLIKCENYDFTAVEAAVRRAVALIGDISTLVRPGERILIKPNLLGAKEPDRHITTHPEIVRAIVRMVKNAGATPVVGDSPGGAIKGVERVWEKTGMKQMALEEGIELINFETAGSREIKINHPGVPTIQVSKAVLDCDGIINVPKLKSHGLMIFTGAIKNFYGIIPGLRKATYHKLAPHPDEFGELLAEIYGTVLSKIRCTVIDGIVAMEGNGPSSGDLRRMDLIAASRDGLALDTTLTRLLGFDPMKIDMLHQAARKGLGEFQSSRVEIVGDDITQFHFSGFKFPSNWYIKLVPHFFVNILGKLIWLKPQIQSNQCRNCMLCVESCPVKAIVSTPPGKPVVVLKDCISCLCCHELCPYKAIELKKSMLSKLLIRQ
ncbi:MAG: DUF362 domain-containing protein [Elusimicrobia bacterium]|nr:DUF362 domain-containing protein [Elusimicrobiota bacterium]